MTGLHSADCNRGHESFILRVLKSEPYGIWSNTQIQLFFKQMLYYEIIIYIYIYIYTHIYTVSSIKIRTMLRKSLNLK